MTDFRALCAELADELTQFNAWYIEDNGYGLPDLEALLRRCDAALAEQPVGPTDEDAAEIIALIRAYSSVEPVMGTSRVLNESAFGAVARAVLARWGQPE